MLNISPSENCRWQRVMNAQAAGTTVVNGSSVDMLADGGYDGVLFVMLVGALTATQVTQMKAQSSSDNASADAFADLEGSKTTALADGDGNKIVLLDIRQPRERYVRPVAMRATANAVIDGIIAIQYRGAKAPAVHPSTVANSKLKVNPAEGTA